MVESSPLLCLLEFMSGVFNRCGRFLRFLWRFATVYGGCFHPSAFGVSLVHSIHNFFLPSSNWFPNHWICMITFATDCFTRSNSVAFSTLTRTRSPTVMSCVRRVLSTATGPQAMIIFLVRRTPWNRQLFLFNIIFFCFWMVVDQLVLSSSNAQIRKIFSENRKNAVSHSTCWNYQE